MKATVEELNSVQRRVSITVPSDVVTKAFNKVYAGLQKKARIDGFRPGKAPLTVIKRLYSHQAARDVADVLVDDHLYSAISENQIKVISAPVVEIRDVPSMDSEYSFSAVVDLMPQLVLNACYKGLSLAPKEYSFTETTVDRELKALARRMATASDLAEGVAAAQGHLGTITHHGTVDGVAHPAVEVKSAAIALGEGEVLPMLEAGMLGMKKGESKELAFSLPGDYGDAALAGKAVALTVILEDLKQLSIPVIDDQFAKDMNCADLGELRQKIREQLHQYSAEQEDRSKREEFFKALSTQLDFEVPPVLVDQTIDSMIQEYTFLNDEDKKKAQRDSEVRKSLRAEATTKVKNTLILWQIGKEEAIEVSDSEVHEELLKRYAELAKATSQQLATLMEKVGQQVRESILLEKAMQLALASAICSTTPVVL